MLGHPSQDLEGSSLPAKIAGKASRFLARNVRSKALVLRNIAPIVTFTFDDVPASACDTGASILERYDARGTFYVAGRSCSEAGYDGLPLASIDLLRTVWGNGHEIGCHTYSHPAVSRISFDQLGVELERNRQALKDIDHDVEVRNFAYPYGDLTFRTKHYLEARFDSCRSIDLGINAGIADLGSLKAWPLESASIDRAKIAELIARTIDSSGWLIFYSHDVAERPSKYGVSPGLLQWAVDAAKTNGCVVVTLAGALKLIAGAPNRNDHSPPKTPTAEGSKADVGRAG
jgi:peptidoglycan/xylan/chitin deacetylase (PgdA/CDA1 family)